MKQLSTMVSILGSAFLVALSPSLFAADRPNVIVIMADDLGYADVGFQGCKDISTPNIDQLAKDGARFLQGYVRRGMRTSIDSMKHTSFRDIAGP